MKAALASSDFLLAVRALALEHRQPDADMGVPLGGELLAESLAAARCRHAFDGGLVLSEAR